MSLSQLSLAYTDVAWNGAFATFNSTIGGRLQSATPLALPCFSNYDGHHVIPDPQGCSIVQDIYNSESYRSLRYGNTIYSTWEACLSKHEQCLLDYGDITNSVAYNNTECDQGSISYYYLEVQDASDVIEAFAFSKRTGVPLSIKNSGHDLLGRSTMKGSLALWMRNLTSLSYHEAFVPSGCPSVTPYQAITAGTGATTLDVYRFADENNVTAVGGAVSTIAWHGGWVIGGGHGSLSPNYGLGVDRILEFKVVTPDGQLRIANQCQNSDLFWALRGGGGSTFGVVLEATSRVEKSMALQVATFSVNYTPEIAQKFYSAVVSSTEKLSSDGWGGSISVISQSFLVNPNLALAEASNSLQELSDAITSVGGNFTLQTAPSWLSFYEAAVISGIAATPNALASRLIPKRNFASEKGQSELLDLLGTSPGFYITLVTPVLSNGTANETSVTPAWRNSLWHLMNVDTWAFGSTVADIKQIFVTMHNVTEALRVIAPDSGAYFNEADVYETDYEESFWGANYPALLKIKQKYDPDGLLNCWHCVGWRESPQKSFECYIDLSSS